MKRNKLIKHLTENGCFWEREGSNHTIYFNPQTNTVSPVPRHREIGDKFCNEIWYSQDKIKKGCSGMGSLF